MIEFNIPFIFKGKNSKTATNLAKNLSYDDWKYINFTTEVAEYGEVEMKSYPFKVRIILIKKIDAKGEIIFNHLLTSKPKKQYDYVEIFSLYNRRDRNRNKRKQEWVINK